jgi:hypothetical protein
MVANYFLKETQLSDYLGQINDYTYNRNCDGKQNQAVPCKFVVTHNGTFDSIKKHGAKHYSENCRVDRMVAGKI